jgi:drug/metabolite transporter (DMT)-like permease
MANAGARLAPYLFILLWSSSFVTARVGLALVSPLLFVAVRLVAATALLGLVLAVRRQSLAPLRDRWHHLALAGVLLNGITLSAFHVGMVTENAAVIALTQTLSPLLIAVSAVPLLGERLAPRQWLGLALGAVGVLLVVAPRALAGPAALHAASRDRRPRGRQFLPDAGDGGRARLGAARRAPHAVGRGRLRDRLGGSVPGGARSARERRRQ